MGIRDFYRSAREYLSRAKNRKTERLSSNSEEDKGLSVTFEEQPLILRPKNIFARTFGAIGKFLGKIALYASMAAVIPAAISFYRTTPERNVWPFRENDKYAYIMKENFDGTIGGVIGPKQTGIFNTLIERGARRKDPKTGQDISNIVEAGVQEGGCEFRIRTSEGYQGKMKVQFLYQVTNEDGAKEWFFRHATDRNKLDEIIRGALTTVTGKVTGDGVGRSEEIVYKNKKGEEIKEDYMRVAEVIANENLAAERFGIKVTNFVRESVVFDPESQAMLILPDAERKKAEARIIRAESEAREAEILKDATMRTLDGYIEAGKRVAEQSNQLQRAGDFAMALHDRDNIQQIANSGARIIYVPGVSGAGNVPPVYMPVNFGPVNPPKENQKKDS